MRKERILRWTCFAASAVLFLCSFSGLACIKTSTSSNLITVDSMPASQNTMSYLALGDSYTIGTSVIEGDRYPVQTVQLLQRSGISVAAPRIIATNGWTTADLLKGIDDAQPLGSYKVVSLLIGVNNQYQHRSLDEYRIQFTTLLTRAIQLASNQPSHVFVLSIPDYSVTPFAKQLDTAAIAKAIAQFNDVNREIAAAYKVVYIDVTAESKKAANNPSLVAGDGLHFSGLEYAIWAQLLSTAMKTALQ